MTHGDLYNILKALGYPVAYRVFKIKTNPPFVAYFQGKTENMAADDKVWHKRQPYFVEFYSDTKMPDKEEQLEGMFDEYDIFWNKEEIYIAEQSMYMIQYIIEI